MQAGGTLSIATTSDSTFTGSVAGGGGANSGQAYGGSIFIQGGTFIAFAPGTGATLTISGVTSDQEGSSGTSGVGGVTMNGAGTLVLQVANTFTGGIDLDSGILVLCTAGAGGTGTIDFGGSAELVIDAADTPGGSFANTVDNFAAGASIDLTGMAYDPNTTATLNGNTIEVSGSGATVDFTITGLFSTSYMASSDGSGGQLLTAGQPTGALVGSETDLDAAITAANASTTAGLFDIGLTGHVTMTGAPSRSPRNPAFRSKSPATPR